MFVKEFALVAVVIGWILTIVSMFLLVVLVSTEGIGVFYVIIMISLILNLILLVGFFVLIIAATRGGL